MLIDIETFLGDWASFHKAVLVFSALAPGFTVLMNGHWWLFRQHWLTMGVLCLAIFHSLPSPMMVVICSETLGKSLSVTMATRYSRARSDEVMTLTYFSSCSAGVVVLWMGGQRGVSCLYGPNRLINLWWNHKYHKSGKIRISAL